MVVLTNKKDKSTVGFLMTLVPDKAYYESTHFDALRSNYKQWQKGYSGYVFYHTLDGKFNNGWKFANGKVIKKVTQTSNDDIDIDMGAKKKAASNFICTTETWIVWYQTCTTVIYSSESFYIDCGEYYYGYSFTTTNCVDDGTGENTGGGSSSYGFDCAGVQGGTAYLDSCQVCVGGTTGKTDCAETVDAITTNISADVSKVALDKAFYALLQKCGYEKMYDYLVGANDKFSSISINPTKNSGYNYSTGALNFQSNSNIYSDMPEEFIHFFQDHYYSGGMANYIHNANFEFEAKLIQDLQLVLSGTSGMYYGDPNPDSIDYTRWLYAVTNNGTHLPSYQELLIQYPVCNNLSYWDFLNAFSTNPSKPSYNLPVISNLTPQAILFINNHSCN